MEAEKVFITMSVESQPTTSLERVFEAPLTAVETGDSLGNMCRLCASETEFVVPIYEGDGLQNSLAEKINKHLPIQVSSTDTLPLVVCYQCASTLLAWHELVQCCVQADHAMRTRYSIATSPAQVDQPNNQASHNQSPEITRNIKTVLTNYFHSLNMEEYSSQVQVVCHACDSTCYTGEDFVDHVTSVHTDLIHEHDIAAFVKDNATFEQVLQSDSDGEARSVTSEPLEERKPLPTLLCPYCESSFSATSRLISHLNTHKEISMELGVECCDTSYTNKREFVSHLQRTHINRLVYDTATMCKSCGHNAETEELLGAHVAEKHKQPERKPVKESPRNQKCIPAVCPECNKTFSNKYNMLFHMKSHKESEAHVCDTCGKSYTTRGNLAQHRRAAHLGLMRHLCRQCGEAFPSGGARDVHARLHTGAAPYACPLCDKSFRATNTLRNHMKMHYDVRDYESPRHARAPRCFSRSNANTRSRRPTILEERDEDDRIDLKAPSDSSIEDVHDVVPVALPRNSPPRAATDSESTPPPAEDAPPGRGPEPSPPDIKWKPSTPETVAPSTDDFRNDTNGPDHKTPTEKVPGEADRNETPCDSPDRPNEFSDHSDVENEFEPLPNSVFEAIEDTQDVPGPTSLDKNTKHSGAHGKPPRTCPVCNRSYSASSSYYYHLKTHSNDDCECDVCGKKFKTKSALAVHGATHGERRSFSCRKCEKKFSSSAGRYIHERTHTDRKQFACVQCNAAFRWRAQLNRHYARHGSARPHACAQCARAFVTRADLRRHARTHRPGAHACRLCGTRFAQERYLKVHMDKKHYEDGANKPDVKTMYLVKNVSRSGEVIVLNDL